MVNRSTITLPVISLCAVGVLCALDLYYGAGRSREPRRSEAEVALAYACGYRNGQAAIMARMPSLFEAKWGSKAGGECPGFVGIAAKHGFAQP